MCLFLRDSGQRWGQGAAREGGEEQEEVEAGKQIRKERSGIGIG